METGFAVLIILFSIATAMTEGGIVLERHGRKVAAQPTSGQLMGPCTNTAV